MDESFITLNSFMATGCVRHCFSTRRGGCSSGPFESLNLGMTRGDNRALVLKNYRVLAGKIGFSTKDMVYSHQVHGVEIRAVGESDKGSYPDSNHIQNVDGLITDRANIVLVIFTADCVPLLFLDPVRKVIAASHAGWRGTVQGIGRITVERMQQDYGCRPEDILTGIGPSIGGCCFEVDTPVAEEFLKLPEGAAHVRELGGGKSHIDLWQVNRNILLSAGILPKNIEMVGLCTKCNEDMFYSHRRSGTARGSMAAFLELLQENENG